jgi:hypothetical protein
LSGVLAHFTQGSKRDFYAQGYRYVRDGEYQKGWDEFKKAFGSPKISKLLRAGEGAMAVVLSKPGAGAPNAVNFQTKKDPGAPPPVHPPSGAGDPAQPHTSSDRPDNFSWGFLLALILSGAAAGIAISLVKAGASYEYEFKWRIQDREYTGKLACKDEADLRRRLQFKGGELLEVLQKIKVAFTPARPLDPRQSGNLEKYPNSADETEAGAVRGRPRNFGTEPQPPGGRAAWVEHLAWCVIGFYIFFVLFWLVWGGIFLLSAH